jgi:hypothetical protein
LRKVTQDESFALLAAGHKCTQCGNPDVVMISIPSAEGVPFGLDEVGEKAWCKECATVRFAVAHGSA